MKLILTVLMFCAGNCLVANAQQSNFKELQAIVGIWKMETSRGVLYEEWQLRGNNELSGRSYKLNNTDTIVLENTTIGLKGNTIVFSANVSNQNNGKTVPFTLVSNTDKRYIFENKEHDFPQRVIYHLVSANELQARIEGSKNGRQIGSDFSYKRMR